MSPTLLGHRLAAENPWVPGGGLGGYQRHHRKVIVSFPVWRGNSKEEERPSVLRTTRPEVKARKSFLGGVESLCSGSGAGRNLAQ